MTVDMDEQAIEIHHAQAVNTGPMVFKVPKAIFNINKHSYEPEVYRFGLLYESLTDRRSMENVQNDEGDIEIAKNFYGLDIRNEINMLMSDAKFIADFAVWYVASFDPRGQFYNDMDVFLQRFIILRDVFLLENQIPLKLVIKLLRMKYCDEYIKFCLENLVHLIYPFKVNERTNDFGEKIQNDFNRICILSNNFLLESLYNLMTSPKETGEFRYVPPTKCLTASQLKAAGINICSREGNVKDVQYKDKVLCLPMIKVYSNTFDCLKNLIIYEKSIKEAFIIQYTSLMDDLIDTDEDTEILVRNKIIINHMNSISELTRIWNDINKGTVPIQTTLWKEIFDDVNRDYNKRCAQQVDKFLNRYKSKPWLIISVLSALILLVMTLLSTIYTILIYFYTTSRSA